MPGPTNKGPGGPLEGKSPTRDNSVVSLVSTRTAGTATTETTQLPTSRTATTTRSGVSGPSVKSSKTESVANGGRQTVAPAAIRGHAKGQSRTDEGDDAASMADFDLGTFFNFAEWYGDDPYMTMALALFEKAPPGTVLRTPTMLQVLSRRYQDVGPADADTMDERDRVVTNCVVFSLPTITENGNFNWEKVTYRLPIERDKQNREARLSLLKFLDNQNSGRMTIEDLKLGFARIVTMPGLDNPEHMLDEVIRHAQRAVQDLMLDGAPRHNDDIITKEFRVFLMFLQGYMDLWEIFFEVDDSGDEMVMLTEFCKCAPKLKAWGMNDPALIKNPSHVFSQIDKDESGYVTFGEFADFCVRKGLMEEIAKDLRNV